MSYVMPMVRWAREEGLEQGLEQGRREELQRLIREILRRRFGSAAEVWSPAVAEIEDAARLRELETRAWEAPSAEEFGCWVCEDKRYAGGGLEQPFLPGTLRPV